MATRKEKKGEELEVLFGGLKNSPQDEKSLKLNTRVIGYIFLKRC
jgi:hypothetical protein